MLDGSILWDTSISEIDSTKRFQARRIWGMKNRSERVSQGQSSLRRVRFLYCRLGLSGGCCIYWYVGLSSAEVETLWVYSGLPIPVPASLTSWFIPLSLSSIITSCSTGHLTWILTSQPDITWSGTARWNNAMKTIKALYPAGLTLRVRQNNQDIYSVHMKNNKTK